jgi:hypothetical protein
LNELLKQPSWKDNEDSSACFKEAQQRLGQKP